MTARVPFLRVATMLALLAIAGCGSGSNPVAATSDAATQTTFSPRIGPGGRWTTSFATTQAGVISVTLVSVSPTPVRLGVAVGITGGATACTLSQAAVFDPGPSSELTVNADAGGYCVSVFDPGTLADATNFTAIVSHP